MQGLWVVVTVQLMVTTGAFVNFPGQWDGREDLGHKLLQLNATYMNHCLYFKIQPSINHILATDFSGKKRTRL